MAWAPGRVESLLTEVELRRCGVRSGALLRPGQVRGAFGASRWRFLVGIDTCGSWPLMKKCTVGPRRQCRQGRAWAESGAPRLQRVAEVEKHALESEKEGATW